MTEKVTRKKEKNKLTIISLVLLLVMLGGLIAYLVWFFLIDKTTKTSEKNTSAITCGDLQLLNDSEKGVLPFVPNLEAEISGEYNSDGEICELFLDGKTSGKYKPIDGKCKFDSLKILVSGKYNVSYKAMSKNGEFCGKKITVSSGPDIEIKNTGEEKESYKLYDTP